ncbi:hypothetical protein PTKIN_Ptkin16aG0076400 [Pterospermum kingtungense]
MRIDARYIIMVEKDAIFQRLASDHVFRQNIPSILLTVRGYPDTATRKPAGLAALSAYKFGSTGIGLEAYGHGTLLQFRPKGYGYGELQETVGSNDAEKGESTHRSPVPSQIQLFGKVYNKEN